MRDCDCVAGRKLCLPDETTVLAPALLYSDVAARTRRRKIKGAIPEELLAITGMPRSHVYAVQAAVGHTCRLPACARRIMLWRLYRHKPTGEAATDYSLASHADV